MPKQEKLLDSQSESVSAILDQLNPDSQSAIPAHLKAAHLLVTAMDGKETLYTFQKRIILELFSTL